MRWLVLGTWVVVVAGCGGAPSPSVGGNGSEVETTSDGAAVTTCHPVGFSPSTMACNCIAGGTSYNLCSPVLSSAKFQDDHTCLVTFVDGGTASGTEGPVPGFDGCPGLFAQFSHDGG